MDERVDPTSAASAADPTSAGTGSAGTPRPATAQLRQATIRLACGLVLVVGLVAVYVAAPEPKRVDSPWGYAVLATLGLLAYVALTVWGMAQLRSARYPVAEGVVLVAVMATIIILGYAYVYQAISAQAPGSFTEQLTRTGAVYFTVTVLTTVGFGDITPVTDVARLAVTSQMLVGLTVISVSIKLIVQSTRSALTQKASAAAHSPSDPTGTGEPAA